MCKIYIFMKKVIINFFFFIFNKMIFVNRLLYIIPTFKNVCKELLLVIKKRKQKYTQ